MAYGETTLTPSARYSPETAVGASSFVRTSSSNERIISRAKSSFSGSSFWESPRDPDPANDARRRWKMNAIGASLRPLLRNRTNWTRTGSVEPLSKRSRVAARSSAGVRNASWIVLEASRAAASCAAAIAPSTRDARRITSAHSWRARATALGSNPNPRADASTSRVALLSATAARSHASAASALASSARSVDMVCPAERTASLLRRECVNCRHGRGL